MAQTHVRIPGQFIAHYEGGKITGYNFIPEANNAGFFGPAATVCFGDERLDVFTEDGPFWTAVTDSLPEHGVVPVYFGE